MGHFSRKRNRPACKWEYHPLMVSRRGENKMENGWARGHMLKIPALRGRTDTGRLWVGAQPELCSKTLCQTRELMDNCFKLVVRENLTEVVS